MLSTIRFCSSLSFELGTAWYKTSGLERERERERERDGWVGSYDSPA